MEERIEFGEASLRLEGLLERGAGSGAAVLTHPHPLYGGDMYNPVVECLQQSYRQKGFTTLRFNFRGTGKSGGTFGEGAGEQQDVNRAAGLLADRGFAKIDLAGYSFGAWVNAHAAADLGTVGRIVMISPPVAFMDLSGVGPLEQLSLVVTGSRDEIAPATEIRKLLQGWNPKAAFEIIEGADHFYWGHLDALETILLRHITSGDGR